MSTYLDHDAADIVRYLLIDIGLGTDPSDNGLWPIYDQSQNDKTDNAIFCFDTEGVTHGRNMVTGEIQQYYGVQVMVRCNRRNDGKAKAKAIEYALDRTVRLNTVSIAQDTGTATSNYTVWSFKRTSQLLPLGTDIPNGKRYLWTINGIVAVTAQQ